jgi:hypothetical protein
MDLVDDKLTQQAIRVQVHYVYSVHSVHLVTSS